MDTFRELHRQSLWRLIVLRPNLLLLLDDRFGGLWDAVYIDMWDDYLEPA